MKLFLNFMLKSSDGQIIEARSFFERQTIETRSDCVLTYDNDCGTIFKLVTRYEEGVIDKVIKALMNLNTLGDFRFTFYSKDYSLGCHLFTDRNNYEEIRKLVAIDKVLSFVAKFAPESRRGYVNPTLFYGTRTVRFRPLNASHFFTRIWDVVDLIMEYQSEGILSPYKQMLQEQVEKILQMDFVASECTLEELINATKNKTKLDRKKIKSVSKILKTNSLFYRDKEDFGYAVDLFEKFSETLDESGFLEVLELVDIDEGKAVEIARRLKRDLAQKVYEYVETNGVKKVIKEELDKFMGNYLTLGGDPEMMGYRSIRDRYPMSARVVVKFSEDPTYYTGINIGSIGTDAYNSIYEIRPSVSKDPVTLLGKFYKLLSYGNVRSDRINKYISVWNSNCHSYPLGGHIHIGSSNVRFLEYLVKRSGRITEELDHHYKLSDVFRSLSTRSRVESGYARSSFEVKSWGFEYRTPPSIVWTEPKLFMLVTTSLILVVFREYLRWEGHEMFEVIEPMINSVVRDNLVPRIIKQAENFNNKLFYVGDSVLEEKLLKRISAALGIRVNSIDDMITKGEKMYYYYIQTLIDTAIDTVTEPERITIRI